VKCVLVEHLHEDMRRAQRLRERIADFGVFAPERRVDAGLANLVRHLLQAPFDGALVGAFYRVIKPAQAEAYRRHLAATLRLNDAPTVAALEDHLPKLDRQMAWAKQLLEGPALPTPLALQVEAFEDEIRRHLDALGGLFRPQGRTDVTGGSSIAELEAALAGTITRPPDGSPRDDIDELTENAKALRNGKSRIANGHLKASRVAARRNGSAAHAATRAAAIPEYRQYVRPRVMALEPRFGRQTAERQHDEPWKEDILAVAAYTHFTELPVIDICAAIVYDGRDVEGLGGRAHLRRSGRGGRRPGGRGGGSQAGGGEGEVRPGGAPGAGEARARRGAVKRRAGQRWQPDRAAVRLLLRVSAPDLGRGAPYADGV